MNQLEQFHDFAEYGDEENMNAVFPGSPYTDTYTAALPHTMENGRKRKRTSPEADRSSASVEADTHNTRSTNGAGNNSARPTPLKRACNECRQQKLRCDVQVEPDYHDCSRCRRLHLNCRIDANFRRIGKRSRNAEMEKEIQELRRETVAKDREIKELEKRLSGGVHSQPQEDLSNAQLLARDRLTALHQGAAGSLMDLKHSRTSMAGEDTTLNLPRLGNIQLSEERIEALFKIYFTFYHPFLPLLDPDKAWDYYEHISPLLFWTIISVATRRDPDDATLLQGVQVPLTQLVWSTTSQVPQNYHIVKAFCLLCTWPLPTKSTSTDPTFIYSGLMMSIALQTGLHRPSHVQDFSRIRVELRDEDVRDRLTTWATCNMVSQAVSTGYGMPPRSIYDYTLMSIPAPEGDYPALSPEVYWRLQIERFSDRVSRKFYVNRTDSLGVSSDSERKTWMGVLVEEYQDLTHQISRLASPIATLHLLAAGLHLRLVAFFDSPTFPGYRDDLLELYHATTSFLTHALELNAPASTSGALSGGILSPSQSSSPNTGPYANFTGIPDQPTLMHVGFYIIQLLLAGGFTLMKLLNSFFAYYIDAEAARRLFNATVRSIRAISLSNNDLPARLAEVLAQLWRSSGAGANSSTTSLRRFPAGKEIDAEARDEKPAVDSSLQLKVRCRMSISLLFDSVWRWREEHQFRGGADNSAAALANLDRAAEHPTEVDEDDGASAGLPGATHAGAAQGQAQDAEPDILQRGDDCSAAAGTEASGGGGASALLSDSGLPSAAMDMGYGDLGYEVFDPLTWMLDGDLEFPSYANSGAQMFGNGLG